MSDQDLSLRIRNIQESATLEMTKLSRKLISEGHNVIPLSIGEPDFNTPEPVKKAAKKAIDDNFSHYTPVAGYLELRTAIANKLKRDNGLEFQPEQVVVSNGAKQSIANVILCLVNPDEEVIIPSPYWVSYPEIVKLAGGRPVFLPATVEANFKVTAEQVELAITPKTKAFIFSSPSNPTGMVYSREELEALAAVFKRNPHVYVISDEIYEYINYIGKHDSIGSVDELKNRVIIINGVSKGYAMTGWRIGYMAAPLFLSKACEKLQGQYTSGASSIAQLAALEALNNCDDTRLEIQRMIGAFRERRDTTYAYLTHIPGIKCPLPDGASYFFFNVRAYYGKSYDEKTIHNSSDFCMYILHKAHVALVPGDAFGNDHCVRLSFATSLSLLEEALGRIKHALLQLS